VLYPHPVGIKQQLTKKKENRGVLESMRLKPG